MALVLWAACSLVEDLGFFFDDDPRQWRLYADFIGSTGSIFDLSTQLYPAYFLPLASVGNLAKKVRISLIGDSTKLPKQLQMLLSDAVEATKNYSRPHLIVAVNYSGQNDIVQAFQKIALKVKDGLVVPEEMNKFLVEMELETNCTDYPNPDLLIRTSGELRISNFLLWQLAYTELYFANSPWPDFGEDELVKALSSFQQRQRLYCGRSY